MVKNFADLFICFDMIHERDGRTPHDGIWQNDFILQFTVSQKLCIFVSVRTL